MAKKVIKKIKAQIPGGAATPAPPLGPTLGQAGINIGEFVSKFNEATPDKRGDIVPVEITVYEDRSFDFITKTPPAASLLLKAAGVEKGSSTPQSKKVGKVTKDQVREIAEIKMPDLNTDSVEAAMRIIEGTARNMGIDITS